MVPSTVAGVSGQVLSYSTNLEDRCNVSVAIYFSRLIGWTIQVCWERTNEEQTDIIGEASTRFLF